MDIWDKFNDALTRVIKFMLIILMIALVFIVFFNSIGRYALGKSIPWGDEGSRFLFIWTSFLGAILAFQTDSHMKFRLVLNSVPKRASRILVIVGDLIILGLLVLLFKGGFIMVSMNMDWLTPALEIPYGAVYLIVPVAFATIGILCAGFLVSNIMKLIKETK